MVTVFLGHQYGVQLQSILLLGLSSNRFLKCNINDLYNISSFNYLLYFHKPYPAIYIYIYICVCVVVKVVYGDKSSRR